jgi:hypothetical protein
MARPWLLSLTPSALLHFPRESETGEATLEKRPLRTRDGGRRSCGVVVRDFRASSGCAVCHVAIQQRRRWGRNGVRHVRLDSARCACGVRVRFLLALLPARSRPKPPCLMPRSCNRGLRLRPRCPLVPLARSLLNFLASQPAGFVSLHCSTPSRSSWPGLFRVSSSQRIRAGYIGVHRA